MRTNPFSTKHGTCSWSYGAPPSASPDGSVESIASGSSWLTKFLPRSQSKTVFVLVTACYAFTAGALAQAIATAFGAPYPLVGAFAGGSLAFHVLDNLLLAPVGESLILIGTIELLRWLRFPASLQVTCSAVVSASLHAFVSIGIAFVVAPSWFIMSIAYLVWRRASWKTGFIVVASIHALLNLIPAIFDVSYALRHN